MTQCKKEYEMVTILKGAIKFKSIKAAYESAKKKNPELLYITFYMRQRAKDKRNGLGWTTSQAYAKPVRQYNKQQVM